MSQAKTFNKLKQPPLEKMLDMLCEIKRPPPVYSLGSVTHSRDDYYSEIQYHLERVMLLEQHGWKYDEFSLALEKRSILAQIKEFNNNTEFPMELINRAKKFFPNAKFTEASIELE